MRRPFVLAVRQLQPPVVDLDGTPERRGRLHRTPERTRHDEVDLAAILDVGSDRHCLLAPSIVEVLVETALQAALQVRLGAAVSHEDQHALQCSTAHQPATAQPRRSGTASSWPLRMNSARRWRRRDRCGATATRRSPGRSPPTAGSTSHGRGSAGRHRRTTGRRTATRRPRCCSTRRRTRGAGSSRSAVPAAACGSACVRRWRSSARPAAPTLTVTLCSARAPPATPSAIGSTEPTIRSR